MDYESFPFGCFHCFKIGHKAFQCLEAKSVQKKKNPSAASLFRVKKVWKIKTTNQGHKGPLLMNLKGAEASNKINQFQPSNSTLPLGMDGKTIPQVELLETAPNSSLVIRE